MVGFGFRNTKFILAASFILFPAFASAQLPIGHATPGKTSGAKKDTLCAPDFAASVKPISDRQATIAFERYGIRFQDAGIKPTHLIPPSLGGTNDPDNLWPLRESAGLGPAQKQALDEKLSKMMCGGEIQLRDAQNALKKNWVEAYKKYVTQ